MKRRQGSAFVLALVVIVAVSAILAMTASRERVNVKATINRLESRRARLAAEAGIQAAMGELANLESTSEVDRQGSWATFADEGTMQYVIGDTSFRVQIVDASSLVSLNRASEEQLQNLNLTTAQIDSLLDWREAGDTARTEGAKDDYYRNLPQPYTPTKGRLSDLKDVLLVKDWVPSTLFATDNTTTTGIVTVPLYELCTVESFAPNTDGSGTQRQNINTAQVQQLVQQGISQQAAQAIIARRNGLGSFTSINQAISAPGVDVRTAGIILDRYWTDASDRVEGLLNLNTAPEEALMTLPGMTQDVASAIVSRQQTGILQLSELSQIPGVTTQLLGQMADLVSVGSDTFLVRVRGSAGDTVCCLEAVVRMQGTTPTLLKVSETPYKEMMTVWTWSQDAVNDTVLKEAGS